MPRSLRNTPPLLPLASGGGGRWIQRTIALFDAAAFGFVADRIGHSPLWGVAGATIAAIFLLWVVSRRPLTERLLKLDRDSALTLRTVALSLLFLVLCAAAALLTLSP